METIHEDFRQGEAMTGCLLKVLLGLSIGGVFLIFVSGLLLGLYVAGGF